MSSLPPGTPATASPLNAIKQSRSLLLSLSLALAIILAAAAITWTLAQSRLNFDDPYITYRYARNLAEGQGFVYNPGQRVLGTTAPLYALLLAGLSRIGLDIPSASSYDVHDNEACRPVEMQP